MGERTARHRRRRIARSLVVLAALVLILGPRADAHADEVELSAGGIQCVAVDQCAFADEPDKSWLTEEP